MLQERKRLVDFFSPERRKRKQQEEEEEEEEEAGVIVLSFYRRILFGNFPCIFCICLEETQLPTHHFGNCSKIMWFFLYKKILKSVKFELAIISLCVCVCVCVCVFELGICEVEVCNDVGGVF